MFNTIMQFDFLMLVQYVLIIGLGTTAVTICVYPSEQSHLSHPHHCASFESLFNKRVWPPDTCLQFSFGVYSLSRNDTVSINSLLVRNTSNFSILGDSFGPTVIKCDGRWGFTFINVTNLTIANIQFVQCGAPVNIKEPLQEQPDSIPPGTHAALILANIRTLHMANASIEESDGYGMLCVNLYGESHIVGTSFTNNSDFNSRSEVGGSIHLLYHSEGDAQACSKSDTSSISMSGLYFLRSSYIDRFKPKASCLLVIVKQTCCFVRLSVDSSVFVNNYVPIVALYDLSTSVSYEIEVRSSNFTKSLEKSTDPTTDIHVVTYISSRMGSASVENTHIISNNKTMVREIRICDCVFSDNQPWELTRYGYIDITLFFNVTIIIERCVFLPNVITSAITIRPANQETHSGKLIRIDKCLFMDLKFGAISTSSYDNNFMGIQIVNCLFRNISTKVLSVTKQSPDPNDQLSVFIKNTTFIRNNYLSLYVFQVNNITLSGSYFMDNDYTPIVCVGSKIYFKETNYAIANRGTDGGALSLSAAIYLYRRTNRWEATPPLLYFYPEARLVLRDNKASSKGGAIYVDTSNLYYLHTSNKHSLGYREPCFYQLASTNKLVESRQGRYIISHLPSITLINNTASFAGNSIFGGLDETCFLHQTSLRTRIKFQDFINIPHQLSPSEMAGDPTMICPCIESVVDCRQPELHISVYPGQSIHMYAIATRAKSHYSQHGATPALVNVRIDESRYDAYVGRGQSAQKLDNKCSEIVLSIYSQEPHVNVMISLSGEEQTMTIKATLLGCPLGFQLEDSNYPGCICDTMVKESGCTCSIDDSVISCPPGKWIGNRSNDVIVHHHCPFDYCTFETDSDVTDVLDKQCAHNRSGILCGKCQPGLSLILGSSKCKNCFNAYLLLIIAFTMAGLSLVVLLYGCNLTASRGTANGLIYFANVVQINSSIFVTQNTPKFLTVFIAWLNLDLGFETCFYNGMDMYAKAWLQFVFPVYLWVIVAAIVLLSRHSVTISRMTRDNTVPVLATLFLLSYTKLLRTIITTASFTYLYYPDSTRTPVWTHDGNVPFIKGKHIALFAAGLVATLGFITPYTLLLLISPCLQSWSHHKPLRWVNKIKPFLDANHGPYKTKIRNWTGVMLLVRAVQFMCFAANAEGDPNINLMVILLVGVAPYMVIWIFGTVYKSKANSVLESAFILLLSTLASASLYVRTTSLGVQDKQTVITTSILATVLSLFVAIVAYHSFIVVKSMTSRLTKSRKSLHMHIQDTSAVQLPDELQRAGEKKLVGPSVSYVALSELVSQTDD